MTYGGGPGGPGWDRYGWDDAPRDQWGDWTADGDESSGRGVGIAVAVAAAALLLIGAVVALVVVMGGSKGEGETTSSSNMVTVTSTVSPPTEESTTGTDSSTTATTSRGAAPSGVIEECSDSGGTTLPRAGRGTAVTSCPFANSVRDSYLSAARPGDPAVIEAYSPVTGRSYTMSCTGDEIITCRGGNNAVVHLY